MHSQAVMDKGECVHIAEQSCAVLVLVDLQIKEKRCVHKEIYYHDALTRCGGQRRNESVHSAKQRRVDTVLVNLQMNEKRCVHKEIIS